MANYNLVVNSTFQPFSFERYIQPYKIYGEAYKEVENAFEDLTTKAGVWEGMANEQTDPETYALYKKYADDLKSQADLLATQGLSHSSRKALLDMKGRYSKEITPIEEAYTTKQKLIKEQRDALLKDNTLIFDKDYSTISLDEIMKNPNASYTPLSGKDIATRTATMAKEAGAAILSDPEYTEVFNSQYVQQKIMQGYDMGQILAAAQRDPNAPAALLGIVDTIKQQVGYDNLDATSQAKIDKYINEGLTAAVGAPKVDIVANRAYMTPQERERANLQNDLLRMQKAQADAATYGTPTPDGGRLIKLGGNHWIRYDKDGNIVEQNVPLTPEEEAQQKEEAETVNALLKANTLSAVKKVGFTPVGVVARTGGNWHYGVEGNDAPDVAIGFTRSQVVTNGGNYTYSPDNNEKMYLVTNMETIPGFSAEYMMGQGGINTNTAFGKIVEAARDAGISDEEFRSGNVQIFQVKAKGKGRAGGNYDYIVFRKN